MATARAPRPTAMLAAVLALALVLGVWWVHRHDGGARAEPPLCDSSGRHLDGLRTPTPSDLTEEVTDVRLCTWRSSESDTPDARMVLDGQRLLTDSEARDVLQALRHAGPATRDCVNTDAGVPRAYSLALSVDGTPTWEVWMNGGACPELNLKHAARDPRGVLHVVRHLG